jgi:hypothetical protein
MRETNNLGRIAVHALLILCLTATLAAQTEWKKYEEPDGNFSVLFPGEPKDTVSPSREGIESSHGFSASDGSVYVGVFYASMKQDQKVPTYWVIESDYLARLLCRARTIIADGKKPARNHAPTHSTDQAPYSDGSEPSQTGDR